MTFYYAEDDNRVVGDNEGDSAYVTDNGQLVIEAGAMPPVKLKEMRDALDQAIEAAE